jgi:UDP-glucose 4-epimerase
VAPFIAKSVNIPEAQNQVFNIGADKEYTVNELAQTVMKEMGVTGELRYLPARNEVVNAYSDHSKAKKVFGIAEGSFTTLEEGIKKMAAWAKITGARASSRFDNIEITEKLPSVWKEN